MIEESSYGTAIIILNYNSAAQTIRLYRALTHKPTANSFVLVVDNRSRAPDRGQLKATIPAYSLILNEANLGYAGGNNIGIAAALQKGVEYIWILNPDIDANLDVLDAMLCTMTKHTEFAALMPRIVFREDPSRIYSDGGMVLPDTGFKGGHFNTGARVSEVTTASADQVKEVAFANGSALLLRASALRAVGHFRACFFLYWEETEWCLRAADAGWKVGSLTSVSVAHQSSKKGTRYQFFMCRNQIWLAKLRRAYVAKTVLAVARRVVRNALLVVKRPTRFRFSLGRLVGSAAGLVAGILGSCRER
jgi:hypothetical protein